MTVATRRASEFRLTFIRPDGSRCDEPLLLCSTTGFEHAPPVRRRPMTKGQSRFAGWYWSASVRRHVAYESWLQRDHAMLLDFDIDVAALSSQPFWLHWRSEKGQRRHAPDLFARLVDGGGLVVDVRTNHRVGAMAAQAIAATEQACAQVGWVFRLAGTPDPVLMANVRWLAGYRHPRCQREELNASLLDAFARPRPLFAGADEVGPRMLVLPTLYHLMWGQALTSDLTSAPLGPRTLVWTRRERAR